MTLPGWLSLPYEAAWRLVMENEGLELSGYIAFAGFFALFPFLIFLASLAGFLGDPGTADEFIAGMFEFMPDDVASTLAPAVREVVQSRQGGLLTFSIILTLWFASNGIEALRAGLNRAYKVSEERPVWWLRLQSIGFVVASAIVILFLTVGVIFGPVVWEALGPSVSQALETKLFLFTARYAVAALLLFVVLMVLHRWLPNARQAYRRVLPGALVTVVLLLAGAAIFSWYVGNLADYSVVYGSLGGVAVTLFFFYVGGIIFQFGAEVNAVWRERKGLRDAPQAANGEGEDDEADPRAPERKEKPDLRETHGRT
ncbi:MAG: YihY/virulence factor BrkB family protein [Geminicoccaceae bacterium]|nr:YihY/virulence factor BrkB family protein [Geminicoccaceae bacterium]